MSKLEDRVLEAEGELKELISELLRLYGRTGITDPLVEIRSTVEDGIADAGE